MSTFVMEPMLTNVSSDLPFQDPSELHDIFTTFRKPVEPLREAPRKALPRPSKLLPLPSEVPTQAAPFQIPQNLEDTIAALWKPIPENMEVSNMPSMPSGVESAHPFLGGSSAAQTRAQHLIESGAMTTYK